MEPTNKRKLILTIGIALIVVSASFFTLTFAPIISAYFDNIFNPANAKAKIETVFVDKSTDDNSDENSEITTKLGPNLDTIFLDHQFGIYIPEIKVNASVIADVDSQSEKEYTEALSNGVAHAKGTAKPDQSGNVFLFAHSGENFYSQRDINIHFYLLNQLKRNDKIYVSYNGVIYKYIVNEKRIINPTETGYMGNYADFDTLTIMACWPAGTNWKRIVVIAERAN